MEILILDSENVQIGLFEHFESLVWDERFYEAGAFEIYCIATPGARKLLRIGNRVQRIDGSLMIGIIDTVSEQEDEDGVTHLVASGRDALYLINRRIVAEYKQFAEKNIRTVISNLISNNVSAPSNSARTIPRIRYVDNSIHEAYVTGQYRGETVHGAISSICQSADAGIRAQLNEDDGYFEISLYNGVSRIENQKDNPPLILSVGYGTLEKAEWTNSKAGCANIAYVAGEDTGASRVVVSTSNGYRGENRYEMFVDARDIGKENDDGTAMTSTEYKDALQNRGREKLSEIEYGRTFDATMNTDIYR
ncbi:MAG: siphovirus ReqiPepy6 Gp37-like family protein, partial [Paludibacteraceae bacterium]